jgi:hypothetical protein
MEKDRPYLPDVPGAPERLTRRPKPPSGATRKAGHADGAPAGLEPLVTPARRRRLERERLDQGERAHTGQRETTVFDRVAELERQLAETQAAADKYEQHLQMSRDRNRRWRTAHLDEARELERQRSAAYRARKKQAGS